MPRYQVTRADRLPLPERYRTERRHLGFDEAEMQSPLARFYSPTPRAIQDHVVKALVAGRSPAEFGYEVDDVASRLTRPGYEVLESGWALTKQGTLLVACLTHMPGVTAAMWDWWFGWHSCETARYKLWHPGAHLFSAIGEDRSALPGLTDRQRYVGNVSYVDEYVGASLQRLAIRFVDATELGFEDRPDTTHVCARVGISDVPLAGGWLIHQVRPTVDGAEMRSRFFLDHPQILPIPPVASSRPAMARVLSSPMGAAIASVAFRSMSRRAKSDRTGHDLLHHCATEMNHLAGFLPELYREFAGPREDRDGGQRR